MDAYISSALITLFVVIDPIGLAPIFLSLARDLDPADRRRAAIKASLISALILTFFALLGHRFLDAIGISLPALRIAGGIFLFWIAFEMVFEKRAARKSDAANRSIAADHPDDLAVFPLAVPLMAGPGAITAVMLLAERAGGDMTQLGLLIGLIWSVLVITGLTLLLAIPLERMVSETIRNAITRLLGVILGALAVQFVIDGAIGAVAG